MSQAEEWRRVGDQMGSLADRFKAHYRETEQDEDTGEEVRSALRGLGEALDRVFTSMGRTLRDPEVRAEAKETAGSLASALGATFSELGDELRRVVQRPSEPPASPEEGESAGGDQPDRTGDDG